jgi:oligopeptide/dipeptide ABC transporter ATP-binding protein
LETDLTKHSLLEIENLKAQILTVQGAVKVVNGVSLEIKRKECLGLLGESGSGKTSLILAALGYFGIIHRTKQAAITKGRVTAAPDKGFSPEEWNKAVSGRVLYQGVDFLELDQSERARYMGSHISYVPQGLQGALDPMFSIGEQTGESLEIHEAANLRQQEMRKKVLEYLDLVNLAGARERYVLDPSRFSGGEAQRILIASALVPGPYLVIADEPTSALDVTVQAQILGVLRMVKEEFDVSLLLISHDATVVAELADRVAVMYAGMIMEVGDAVKMYHEPRHPYTRGLMASFPTIVMMQMRAGGKRPKLRGIPGSPPDPKNLPSGCPFHPRCQHAIDICVTDVPDNREVEPRYWVSCHRHGEIG